jgi:tRNA threonylcarbamoyladenosine biosynthesis protein TsaB
MILALETSSKNLGIALGENNKPDTLDEFFIENNPRHSSTLHPNIELILKKNKWGINDIKKVICNTGPGNFTGIRIGLTTAKTLCQLLGIPLVGISSLDAIAAKTAKANTLNTKQDFYICSIVDALHFEVFYAIYHYTRLKNQKNDISVIKITGNTLSSLDDMLYNVHKYKKIIFSGSIEESYIKKIQIQTNSNSRIITAPLSASSLITAGYNKKGVSYKKVNPLYIKPPRIY